MVDFAQLAGEMKTRMPDDEGDFTYDSQRRALQIQTRIGMTNLLKIVVPVAMPLSTRSAVESDDWSLLEPD
jgi:hypothetical protein